MKYVIFKSGMLLKPVIIADVVAHSEVTLNDKKAVPVSAGFFSINHGFVTVLEKGSESLKIGPNANDSKYLEFLLSGFTDISLFIDWGEEYKIVQK